MTTALTANNNFNLANKELKTNINKYVKAYFAEASSAWDKAQACYNIIENELYTEDFPNVKDLYTFLNITKSRCSQITNAYKFVHANNLIKADEKNKTTYGTSVDNAYMLSTLDNYIDFEAYALSNGHVNFLSYSQKALKDLIKEYNKSLKAIDTDEAPADDTAEVAQEIPADDEAIAIETREEAIAAIILMMKKWDINITDLTTELGYMACKVKEQI